MFEYAIVSGENLESLNGIVNEHLRDGWQVAGGPFVVSKKLWLSDPRRRGGELVAQALVRVVENE